MKVRCTEKAELPFILNLPPGQYCCGTGTDEYLLTLQQGQFAAHLESGFFVVGEKEFIQECLKPDEKVVFWQPLKTVVFHESSVDVSEADLKPPDQNSLLNLLKSNIISEDPKRFMGDLNGLDAEADRRLNEQKACEREVLVRRFHSIEISKTLTNADLFLSKLNTLIRLYMTVFDDFFVEEVTYHQLSANKPICGVFTTIYSDGWLIGNYGHVNKIPPLATTPWTEHAKEKTELFVKALKNDEFPDPITLLSIRARNCIEKGALRSAITEISAALDLCLSTRIREGFRSKGLSDNVIDSKLKSSIRFDDRAKDLLRDSTGFSLAQIDNTLWAKLSSHRQNIRHGVTHSSKEPTIKQAEEIIDDFIKAIKVIRSII